MVTTSGTIMVAGVVEPITDVTSVAVGITSSGGYTDVAIGETVNVDVIVEDSTEGVHQATGNTLQYKIAGGASMDIALSRGDNGTHLKGTTLAVADGDTEGAFTFESVTLMVQNADGDAATAATKVYTTTSTVVTLTDANLTIDPVVAVTDVTSVTVDIATSATGTDLVGGDSINVDVIVMDSAEGVHQETGNTLQYKIGTGDSTDLSLSRGDNDTHLTGMLTVDAVTPAGLFTFESVTLSLQNAAGDANTARDTVYTTTSTVGVTLTDAGLTITPAIEVPNVEILANATTADNTAEGGDKVTFTAWITNMTDALVLNVTVNYRINGTDYVTGNLTLTNAGLNGNSTTQNIWNGTVTLADDAEGDLSIMSLVIWAKNMDGRRINQQIITAANANATNVVTVEAAAANTTTSADTSATSSGETSDDSPVSIFAVFILIASVSVVVGVYTLRRRQ